MEMSSPVNSAKNACENTTMPGASRFIENCEVAEWKR